MTIKFTKMQGSGNDFVVVERSGLKIKSFSEFAKRICNRKFGVGADGLLLLEKSKKADIRMRIFNPDGSEAQMCGNGARCCALYVSKQLKKKTLKIETIAGILKVSVENGLVGLNMTDPRSIKLGINLRLNGKPYNLCYLDTGVPHVVIETSGSLDKVSVKDLGSKIRHHKFFKPRGTNVNFIKLLSSDRIALRTYERGVEDETLACGTGSVASAIISVLNRKKANSGRYKIFVKTKSAEVLVVYFKIEQGRISDVWLKGGAKEVFKGEYLFNFK